MRAPISARRHRHPDIDVMRRPAAVRKGSGSPVTEGSCANAGNAGARQSAPLFSTPVVGGTPAPPGPPAPPLAAPPRAAPPVAPIAPPARPDAPPGTPPGAPPDGFP